MQTSIREIQVKGKSPNPDNVPILRFSIKAWLKLMHCRDCYDEEIAAYAVSSKEDLLYIDDIWIPKQEVSFGSFEFDTEHTTACIEWFFVEHGIQPYQCSRIWIHTHPSGVLSPSTTDENTFAVGFGSFSWSIMVIFPKGCSTPYAAMKINRDGVPAFRVKIPVEADYSDQGIEFDLDALKKQIEENVSVETFAHLGSAYDGYYGGKWDERYGLDSLYGNRRNKYRANDVSDLTKETARNPDDHYSDLEEEGFYWIDDCGECRAKDVPVNISNVCIDCAKDSDSAEILHYGDCVICHKCTPINDDDICIPCMEEFDFEEVPETEEAEKDPDRIFMSYHLGACGLCDATEVWTNKDGMCGDCFEKVRKYHESR